MSENTVNVSGNEAGSVTEELPKGFTYFVRDGDVIKIGSSAQPKRRLYALQTGIARPLDVLAVVDMDIADEFTTHQQFAHLRVRGEWFRAEADLLQFIERIKAHHAVKALAAKPEPTAMAKRLTALRRERGAHTQIGYRCTNLLEALPIYEKSTDEGQRAILARSIGRWTTELAGMLKAA
jgi:hypothetical protein